MNARSLAAAAVLAAPALAADADVVSATATRTGETWRFEVTARHADEWRIVGSDGTVYGLSELLHPHVDEQPFTRSLGGVAIPPGFRGVTARQHARPAARVTVDLGD